jgi:heterogeneous nuclear ribonucleoprotein U-like protein 1
VKDAEFIMLCGLPACGKTYWAQKHMEANPTKSFVLLGTNAVIDQMKVMNLNRQRNYADRWEELISQATPIFNKLVEIAGKAPRNIILDQTNVYKNARRRKAAAFQEFGTRRCVTIVNDEETLAQRTEKREREEGKFVPLEAVGQMRSNFVAPELEDGFTAINWPEIPQKDALQRINEIRSQGMNWSRANPNAGNGSKAKPQLQFRTPDQIGRGNIYEKGKMEDRQRSRTPMGRHSGFGQNR